ncbi:MAG TPA: SCP2 sterol-binding domain-containing protein [Myxococcaceae bacterium]|nr:SCP2 sterol-binding domain-containing protein [Myxococcaceae bacterium]
MENTASTKAHKFFGETLPALVEAQLEKHLANKGRISFRIGEESWTFRFGEAEAVHEGADEAAGLKMYFEPSAFDQFLASNLDMRLAVNAGTIKAEGDFELLKQFGLFIEAMTPRHRQVEEPQKFNWNFS